MHFVWFFVDQTFPVVGLTAFITVIDNKIIIQSPDVTNIDNIGALRKRKIITKKIPRYLGSGFVELKNIKVNATIRMFNAIPGYPRFMKPSLIIPLLAFISGALK